MKNILFLVLGLLFFSCSSDDDLNQNTPEEIDDFFIEYYVGLYAQYNSGLIPNPDGDNLVKFEYDAQNRITQRIGDAIYTSLGFNYLHDSLYTEITYNNNQATLIKKIHPFGGTSQVRGNQQIITFDSRNRMIKKVDFLENRDPEYDTIHFTYNNNKLVAYVKTYNYDSVDYSLRYFNESTLYYTNDNLDSIITLKKSKWSDEPYIRILGEETHVFSGYDSSQNPFRKLSIFDETFFRSLSKNNFTDYRKKSRGYYYPNNDYTQPGGYFGPSTETNFQTWSFAYDEDGEWIYDQF